MIIVLVVILASVLSYFALVKTSTSLSHCLPSDIKLSDAVEATLVSWFNDGRPPIVNKVTVEQKLDQLHARCQNRKLVDQVGKKIYFYQLSGCWGASLGDEEDAKFFKNQQEKIDKLKERYTVIEMTCNSSGIPIP